MGFLDDLQEKIGSRFTPEDPFAGIEVGRSPEEELFARNQISARGAAVRRGAANRIRQDYAGFGGGPRGALTKAISSANLGANAVTSDALVRDRVSSEASEKEQSLALARARGQFGLNVEQANLGRLGAGLNLAGLAEGARQFNEGQSSKQDSLSLNASLAAQAQEDAAALARDRFEFDEARFRENLQRSDIQRKRDFELSQGQLQRDLTDRALQMAELEGVWSSGVRPQLGIGGSRGTPFQAPPLRRG